VLDENLRVDVKASQALREEMARTRGPHRMFDFGGSIEELKARCKAETGFDPPISPTFATWVRSRQQKLARLQDVKR
jgi:N-methylhydantoinase B